jgi:hypothetical protein
MSDKLKLLRTRIHQAKSASVTTLRVSVLSVADILVEVLADHEASLFAIGGALDGLVAREIMPDPHPELAKIEHDAEIERLRAWLGRIAGIAFADPVSGRQYVRELARCALAGEHEDFIPEESFHD